MSRLLRYLRRCDNYAIVAAHICYYAMPSHATDMLSAMPPATMPRYFHAAMRAARRAMRDAKIVH